MYNLSNFIPYDGEITSGEHRVLVWSSKTGYYFTQFGYAIGLKIIAKEK